MNKEALIILTGITANSAKKECVRSYFREYCGYEVFLPGLWQFFGITFAAWQLCRFLKAKNIERFPRCHFICYISGGFILRQAFSIEPLSNLGRIVYVRSPFQEQVPALTIKKLGFIAAALSHGKMLFDLAGSDKNQLPLIDAEDGVILETGVSQFAAWLGIQRSDFDHYLHSEDFYLPPTQEMTTTALSHDDVYTSDELLAVMAGFLKSGRFQDGD